LVLDESKNDEEERKPADEHMKAEMKEPEEGVGGSD